MEDEEIYYDGQLPEVEVLSRKGAKKAYEKRVKQEMHKSKKDYKKMLSDYEKSSYEGTYLAELINHVSAHPESLFAKNKRAADARKWLIDNNHEEVLDWAFDRSNPNARKLFNSKYLTEQSLTQLLVDDIQEGQNKAGKTVGLAIMAGASIPLLAEALPSVTSFATKAFWNPFSSMARGKGAQWGLNHIINPVLRKAGLGEMSQQALVGAGRVADIATIHIPAYKSTYNDIAEKVKGNRNWFTNKYGDFSLFNTVNTTTAPLFAFGAMKEVQPIAKAVSNTVKSVKPLARDVWSIARNNMTKGNTRLAYPWEKTSGSVVDITDMQGNKAIDKTMKFIENGKGGLSITRTVQDNGKIRLSLPTHTDSKPRQLVLLPAGDNKYYVHIRMWDDIKNKVPASNVTNLEKKQLFNALYDELPEGAEILIPESGPGNYATRGTVAGLQRLARDSRFTPGNSGVFLYRDKDGKIKTHNITSFIKHTQITPKNAASITPKQWTAAQDAAIARGDMAEAQRLRDLHLKTKTSIPLMVSYRGERSGKLVNDLSKIEREPKYNEEDAYQLFFNSSKDVALTYGPTRKFYLNIQNPFVDDFQGRSWSNMTNDGIGVKYDRTGKILGKFNSKEEADTFREQFLREHPEYANDADYVTVHDDITLIHGGTTDALVEQAKMNKNDGAIFENVVDNFNTFKGKPATDFVIFKPSQAKLADAVTYDDNGNRIPLGDRDDFTKSDTRWSAADNDYKLSDGEKDIFEQFIYTNRIMGFPDFNFSGTDDTGKVIFASDVKKGLSSNAQRDLMHNTVGRNIREFEKEGYDNTTNELYRLKAEELFRNVNVGRYSQEAYRRAGRENFGGFFNKDRNFISINNDNALLGIPHVESHEGRHLLDANTSMLDSQFKILKDAYDSDFVNIPDTKYAGDDLKGYSNMRDEMVTTNRDARDVLFKLSDDSSLKYADYNVQDKFIDKASDEAIFEAVEKANGYGGRYIALLRDKNKLTHEKANQFREAMKRVGIYTIASMLTGKVLIGNPEDPNNNSNIR